MTRHLRIGIAGVKRIGLRVFYISLVLAAAVAPRVVADERPSVEVPAVSGTRYELTIPNTLDLTKHMELSLNALTRGVESPPRRPFPDTKLEADHFIQLDPDGPKVFRSIGLYGKAMLAARLARLATGDNQRINVDNDWRRGLIDWLRVDPVMHGPEGGRWLEWIAFNIRCEKGEDRAAWERIANRAVKRLEEAAVPFDGDAWLLVGDGPGDGFDDVQQAKDAVAGNARERIAVLNGQPPRGWLATFNSWTIQGLTALHRETNNPEALRLAGKLAHYVKDHGEVLAPDGTFLAGHEHAWPVVHWHHSFLAAVACAEYGAAANDAEMLDFANTAYQHALSLGSRDVGFAPEYCYGKYPRKQDFDNSEACCTSDLVLTALFLTKSGRADYWDDVDRFVRNQLTEMQMTDTRWFYDLPQNKGHWKFPDPEVESRIGPLVGNFAGWATLNEWHKPECGPGIMTCCLGNCTRAMFYVWDEMVRCNDGDLQIHLLLNHSSKWADIGSDIPYAGRVTIRPKQDCKSVTIRAPEWVDDRSPDLHATRDDQPCEVTWTGRYARVNDVHAGQTIAVTFPIATKTVEKSVGRIPYRLTFKGTTLVSVEPHGTRMPLYERERFLADQAPSHTVTRFVADDAPFIPDRQHADDARR